MTIDGNVITCDHPGCRTQHTFTGELSPEDLLLRYHVMGWRYTEAYGQELHHCPNHL